MFVCAFVCACVCACVCAGVRLCLRVGVRVGVLRYSTVDTISGLLKITGLLCRI